MEATEVLIHLSQDYRQDGVLYRQSSQNGKTPVRADHAVKLGLIPGLPDNYPGVEQLRQAGILSSFQLENMSVADLRKLDLPPEVLGVVIGAPSDVVADVLRGAEGQAPANTSQDPRVDPGRNAEAQRVDIGPGSQSPTTQPAPKPKARPSGKAAAAMQKVSDAESREPEEPQEPQEPKDPDPPQSTSAPKPPTVLPDDFPYRSYFENAGFDTVEAVRALADKGNLTSVSGIGDKYAPKVRAALDKLPK